MTLLGRKGLTQISPDEFAIYHRRDISEAYDRMMGSMACYPGLDFESFCRFCYCKTSLYPARDHREEIHDFWMEKS
jgi:hypothetical protein